MKKIFILFLLLLSSVNGFAYDFEIDGIYYNKLSNNEVEVTCMLTQNSGYSGEITIPKSIKYNNVEYAVVAIGGLAFNNSKITKISIPNSVVTIGSHAFSRCTGLKGNLTIPNSVEIIGDNAFEGCKNLTGALVIPNSVKEIGSYAFSNCSGFTESLTISNSLKEIARNTFSGCSGFSGSLIIPNSVKTIESYAFYDCAGFTGSLIIPNSVIFIGESAFWKCNGFTGSLIIGNSVTDIGNTAFWECKLSGSLIIPNSVQSIGRQAFENCANFSGELTIGSSVSGIGSNAFSGCTGITTLTLLNNYMRGIGSGAFYRCRNLSRVNSKILEPFELKSSVFEGISSDAVLKIPKGTRNAYWNYGWIPYFKSVLEEGETIIDITASGNGSVLFSGSSVRNSTESFIISEGSSVTITFSPDAGYRIKSVKINGATVSIINNQFTVSDISSYTTLSVEFEAIPVTAYSLSIKATGSGSASYGGTTVRGTTKSFTVNEGTKATITFTPDAGYRIKSLKVNGSAKTASSSYDVTVNADTSVEVEFEAIPPTTYTLSIKATGSGSASYSGTTVRGTTKSFSVNEGTKATITFTPDAGYRIKSLKVNGSAKTASSSYDVTVNADTSIEVEFEAIPVTTYTLSIKATGSGSASYGGTTVRGTTKSFSINEGTKATITFTPDAGYRIKSLKVNGSTKTASSSYDVTVNADTSVEVEFEAIPPTAYTLSIKATGNGSASYGGTTVRGTTKSFSVNEGTKATITFTPDAGYRIKSLKVNGSAKTASTSYDVTVNADTSIEVEFEVIPPTTYTLSIKATGNGSASYSGTTVRGTTKSFSVNEGTKATITFTPDAGYRIKSLKVNGSAKTASTSYKVTVNADTSVEVEFEAIPVTTYTLSIKATGSGSASYSGTTIKGTTKSFTLNEGTKATITFTPDAGYQIAKVKVNSSDVTSKLSNNQYTVTVNSNTSVEVEFGKVADSEHSIDGHEYVDLGLPSGGYWSVVNYGADKPEEAGSYLEWSRLDRVESDWGQYWKTPTKEDMQELIDVCEWTWTELNGIAGYSIKGPNGNTMFLPAAGGRDVVSSYKYGEMAYYFTESHDEIIDMYYWIFEGNSSERKMEKEYVSIEKYPMRPISTVRNESVFSVDGLNFTVVSAAEKTANLAKGNYGKVLEVPSEVIYPNTAWKVVGIDTGALDDCKKISAIIWNPNAAFTEVVDNPNLLLYVKDAKYAPASIKNVVVNGTANSIVLSEALYNNDFYCPLEFTAKSIAYTHNYKMETGLGISKGWETIALPFDVQKISHESKGEITPFVNWKSGDAKKPFWLKTYGDRGWTDASGIKANTPYIISMPNNSKYKPEYRLSGKVTFSAENVVIPVSDNLHIVNYNGKYLVPNFVSGNHEYALNVKSDFVSYTGNEVEGSVFLYNLRVVHPFEAYMKTSSGGTRSIAISDDLTTGIEGIPVLDSDDNTLKVYDLNGKLLVVERGKSIDDVKHLLPAGVYIINGKKLMIK